MLLLLQKIQKEFKVPKAVTLVGIAARPHRVFVCAGVEPHVNIVINFVHYLTVDKAVVVLCCFKINTKGFGIAFERIVLTGIAFSRFTHIVAVIVPAHIGYVFKAVGLNFFFGVVCKCYRIKEIILRKNGVVALAPFFKKAFCH